MNVNNNKDRHYYTVNDVNIAFPFEAYKCQLDFMEIVIEGLKNPGYKIYL